MVFLRTSWFPHILADLGTTAPQAPLPSENQINSDTYQNIARPLYIFKINDEASLATPPSPYQKLSELVDQYGKQLDTMSHAEDGQVLRIFGGYFVLNANLAPEEVTEDHVQQLRHLVDLANTYLEYKQYAKNPAHTLFETAWKNFSSASQAWLSTNMQDLINKKDEPYFLQNLTFLNEQLRVVPTFQNDLRDTLDTFQGILGKDCYDNKNALPSFADYQKANLILQETFAQLSAEDVQALERVYNWVLPQSDAEALQNAYAQQRAQLDAETQNEPELNQTGGLLMQAITELSNRGSLNRFIGTRFDVALKNDAAAETSQLSSEVKYSFANLANDVRLFIHVAQELRDAAQFARSANTALQEQAEHMRARAAQAFSIPAAEATQEKFEDALIARAEFSARQINSIGRLALYFNSYKRTFLIGNFDWETEAQHNERVRTASSVASYLKLATRLEELSFTLGKAAPEQLHQRVKINEKQHVLRLYPEALAEELPPLQIAQLRIAMMRDILDEFERHNLWQDLDRSEWQLDHLNHLATEKYQGSTLEGKTVFNPDIYQQRERYLQAFAALKTQDSSSAKRNLCIAGPFLKTFLKQNDHEIYLARLRLAADIPLLAVGGLGANVLKTACAGSVADFSAVLFAEGSNLARASAALGVNGELLTTRAALLGIEGAFFRTYSNTTSYYLNDTNTYNTNESHTYNAFATLGGWIETAAMFGVIGKALNYAVSKAPPWLQKAIIAPETVSIGERLLGKGYTMAVETAAFSAWTPAEEVIEWSAVQLFASSPKSKNIHIETDPWQIISNSITSVIFFRLANAPLTPLHARIHERWNAHRQDVAGKLFDELFVLEEHMANAVRKNNPTSFTSPKERALWLSEQAKKLEQKTTQLLKVLVRLEPGRTVNDFPELQARANTWKMITQAEKAYQKDAQIFGKGNPFGVRRLAGKHEYSAANVEMLMTELQASPRVSNLDYRDGTIRFTYTEPPLPGEKPPEQHEVNLTPYLHPQTTPSEALRQLFLKWRIPAEIVEKIMP